jgi:hypothetical protein
MLCGGDDEYAMSTCMSDEDQQSIANFYFTGVLEQQATQPAHPQCDYRGDATASHQPPRASQPCPHPCEGKWP